MEVVTTGTMPRVWPSSQGDHHCRGTARRPPHVRSLGLANVDVTDDRG